MHRHFVTQKGPVGKRPNAPSGPIYHQDTGRDAGIWAPTNHPFCSSFFLPTVSNNGDRSDASRLFSQGVDTDLNAIKFSEVLAPGNMLFCPSIPRFACFRALAFRLPPWSYRYHHNADGSSSQFLFTTILRRSGSLACWPVTRGSGSTLDAASHLRDFHTLINR